MEGHEGSQELNPINAKILVQNLINLKEKLESLIKLKKDNELSSIITKIQDFTSWLKQFQDENRTVKDKDYRNRDNNLKIIKEKLEKYFNEDEEINNLFQILNLINESKDIIELFSFDPLNETNNRSETSCINPYISSILKDTLSLSKEEEMENFYKNAKKQEVKDNKIPIKEINKDDSYLLNEKKILFIQNFSNAIKILISKFNLLINSKDDIRYPPLGCLDDKNNNYINDILEFFKNILSLDEKSKKISEATKMEANQLIDTIENILNSTEKTMTEEEECSEEELYMNENANNYEFDEVKKKIFYFVDIISKENKKFDIEELKYISEKISSALEINIMDLFLIQNSSIDNFVKSYTFHGIQIEPDKISPTFNKFYELKTLKSKLLIKDYKINNDYFDNRGNFLEPNTRKTFFRGKEPYDPPYKWMGLGLKVLGEHDDGNDEWLENISKESDWAVAYRGINTKKNSKFKVQDYLKYFIERKDLNIAITNNGENLIDHRKWKPTHVGKGIWMTPYIKLAEKYTQTISFNNKQYKVLLMAKVNISKIRQPKGTNFWVLNNEDIRIYRVLFKEINN